MINKTIGNNIQILREHAGFTQSNLAEFLKVDQSLISKIEKGTRAITVDMVEKLASLFGVTLEQMESQSVSTSKLTTAFRSGSLSVEEMEAISAINRIALNSGFMSELLGVTES